ncbi:MAG: hypothetical protein AAB556_02835 [Patescibacteria group bacterium]
MIKINYYHQKKERFFRQAKKTGWLVLLGGAAVWGFFWIPYFKISNIEINNPLIRQSQVNLAFASFFEEKNDFFAPMSNFFLFSSEKAEKIILESDLGVAKVNKKFPNKIELEFLEIKPKFIYCNEDCFYANKTGFLYELAPSFTENPIPFIETGSEVKKIGDYILSLKEAEFLADFLSEVSRMDLNAETISVENDFKIFLKQNWHIILLKNEPRSGAELAEKLKLILEQKVKNSSLEYIDMRFPNKAFYKLK